MSEHRLGPVAWPTLGFQIVHWAMTHLCHGPGDVEGTDLFIDDEIALHICWLYRLWPAGHVIQFGGRPVDVGGRRMARRGVLSRPKGRAKSEIAGTIVSAEACGPVRFDHWARKGEVSWWGYPYMPGEPVGRPVKWPFIRIMATEEGQSGNTYDNVPAMLSHRPFVKAYGAIDIGRSKQTSSRVNLPGGGFILPSTASNASKDGGKESATVFDEPLALDTPVPTPDGWRPLGDLQSGDHVLGVDGRPVLVWGASPVKEGRPCYRMTFDDGESVVADASHRWWVHDRPNRRWRERTTEQMAHCRWHGRSRFAVQQPSALELPERDLPLDPYVFGLWLGDGDSRVATIAAGRQDLDVVLRELRAAGCTVRVYDYDERKGCVAIRFNHGARYGKSGTSQRALRDLGVLENKHVPGQYLWASRAQRLALLQGLMDSDGFAGQAGNCLFTNTSRVLADGVVHLARSLGWRASAGRWHSDKRWGGQPRGTWRVSFTPSGDVPFRLERKASRCRATVTERTRTIRAIEPVDSVPVRCLAVDADDHLFLAGRSMLPTHNTHLYIRPELKKMHRTVSRNTAKRKEAEPLVYETTTAFEIGEQSIAESAHRKFGDRDPDHALRHCGVLYDHREAPKVDGWYADTAKDPELIAALRDVYGVFAEVMDLRRVLADMRDEEATEEEGNRYFLNIPSAASSKWCIAATFDGCPEPERTLVAGEQIALGFDGSDTDDSTVLYACRLEDGALFPLGIWEKNETGWRVPRGEVDVVFRWAMRTFDVARAECDRPYFENEVDTWHADFGNHPVYKERVFNFPTKSDARMAPALKRLLTAMEGRRVAIDRTGPYGTRPVPGIAGRTFGQAMREHFLNAHKRKATVKLEDGTNAVVVSKETKDSPRKIDSVPGSSLAYEARGNAIAAGALKPKRKPSFHTFT